MWEAGKERIDKDCVRVRRGGGGGGGGAIA